MHWGLYFWTVFKSVLLSTGGFGPLPILHTDFMQYGWAREIDFTQALTVGQLAPGPNGLWLISLGYLTASTTGAVLSALALLLPPLFVLLVAKGHKKIAAYESTKGLLNGVVLVVVCLNIIVLSNLFISGGTNWMLWSITALSGVLALSRKVPITVILICAAFIGYAVG